MGSVKYLVASLVIVFVSAPLRAATVVIDSLSVGTLNYSVTGENNINGMNQSGVDTLGGNRATDIDHFSDASTSTVTLNTGGPLTVTGTNNDLTLGYGETYSGGGLGGDPSLNANLSGTNAIEIDFGAPTSSTAGIQLFMSTDNNGGGFGQSDDNGHGVGKHAGDTSVIIPYSSLSASFGAGFNSADVDHIVLTIQDQGTISITKVSAIFVPEPVLLTPLALLAAARRRRH